MSAHRLIPQGRRWVLVPLLIFTATRVIAGVMLHIGANRQAALTNASSGYKLTVPTAESPGYLGVIANWDGQWYWSIAEHGYPSVLPQVNGEVVPNEWAFAPGYPFLVRLLMATARIDFPLAAMLVSITCAAIAMVMLYGMVRNRMDDHAATTVILALCCFPSAPVFQVAYTESMSLLLVVLALWALANHQHWWLIAIAAILSLTRPILLPLAILSLVVWLLRWRSRRDAAFPMRERWISAFAGLACLGMAGVWPAVAAVVTGEPTAFTQTMASWPTNKALGGAGVNWITLAFTHPLLGFAFVFPPVALVVYTAIRAPALVLPATLRWWAPIYTLYVLAATKPNVGILRYALLAIFPLAPILQTRRDGPHHPKLQWLFPALFAFAGLIGQYYWVTKVFTIDEVPIIQPFP